MKVKCPICQYEGGAKSGRNMLIELFLLLTTWFLLWIPLVIYYGATPRWVCPKCRCENVIKQ